jgi:Tfp pilus assembly protein PilF
VDLSQKRPREARARIDIRVAAAPNDTRTLMLAASAYQTLGDLAACERALQRVLGIDANNLAAYAMLARTYLAQHRLDAALARYEEVARRDPKPVAAETMIGIILQARNQPGEAQRHFERALQLDARAAVAANNLAWIYAETGGQLDTALRLAQTAREELPGRAEVNDTLGWIYLKKGLVDLALAPLERSVEEQPSNAVYRYHLAVAYLDTGQRAKARQTFEEALRLQADFAGADQARKLLASVKGR